jgi:hypothetical protein
VETRAWRKGLGEARRECEVVGEEAVVVREGLGVGMVSWEEAAARME